MKVLVTGSRGQLGSELHKISTKYNFEWVFTSRKSFNISDLDNINVSLDKCKPDVIVNNGDLIKGFDWTLEAIHTPGHTSNHVCYSKCVKSKSVKRQRLVHQLHVSLKSTLFHYAYSILLTVSPTHSGLKLQIK